MKIFPTPTTQAETILEEMAGKPKEKVLLSFLDCPKEYVNYRKFSEEGYELVYSVEDGDILSLSFQNFRDIDFGLYKFRGRLWLPDKRMGKAMAIFHYKGSDKLRLEYEPEFLRWGNSESLKRKNIPLKRTGEENQLKLPWSYYFLRD